jgi:adenylosuccinate synthase
MLPGFSEPRMPTSCVIGVLWGDEGKGKIIDLLAEDADVVARYCGGHNAGHTLLYRGERLVLQLIPSGILRPGVTNVIGNGVVVDPVHLVAEIQGLRRREVAIELGKNLRVSERAHVILPLHRALDLVHEQTRGTGRIGTTGRGIGPTYADRAGRSGIRLGDLLRPERLATGVEHLLAEKNPLLEAFGVARIEAGPLCAKLAELGAELAPAIGDTGAFLREALRAGRRVLCEGAQGVMLDVDHGTYPFVTSSSASTGGVAVGLAIPPHALSRVVGVAKAYATRVGEGPFPTELEDPLGSRLREAGREYGSTTGRPRRTGWFDAVAARYAIELAGVTELVLTNLDVLTGFEKLCIANAYVLADGTTSRQMQAFDLDRVEPTYEELPGFTGDISGTRTFAALPAAARRYVERIEELVGVRTSWISVGPGRDQVIRR